jgi:3'-phosphoadenosine 5'-phosphosulfate sulfotransferase (PAPS reductase)/FAD synthetase
MGLRAEESKARPKRQVLAMSNASTKTTRTVDDYLPIHSWTTDEVWARIRASGLRHHQAYDLGMPRLSCAFCIFAPKSALLVAAEHNPELLDTLCDLEERIDHKFKADLSLAEVRESARSGNGLVKVENWTM